MTLRAMVAILLLEAVASTVVAGVDGWLRPRRTTDQRRTSEVAAFVERNTAPEDRILIWGNSPELYWYAHRLPATRYLSANYQTGHVWGAPSNRDHAPGYPAAKSSRAWALLLGDLDRTPPALIVDAAAGGLDHMQEEPLSRQGRLSAWLNAHYRRTVSVAGMPIYERRSGRPSSAPAQRP
jgi:hypothetical protein